MAARLFDLSADDVQVEYKTGKAYLHQHLDIYGRPAVVVRSCKHRIGEHLKGTTKQAVDAGSLCLCVFLASPHQQLHGWIEAKTDFINTKKAALQPCY